MKTPRTSRQYEATYETNLDWERTLNSLLEGKIMKIDEPGPPAIRHLYWKGVFCAFGPKGGLNIHATSQEEMDEFVLLLRSVGVYSDGQVPRWVLKGTKHGLGWYRCKLQEYKSHLQEYRSRLHHHEQDREE